MLLHSEISSKISLLKSYFQILSNFHAVSAFLSFEFFEEIY